jgi:hypothetical protein
MPRPGLGPWDGGCGEHVISPPSMGYPGGCSKLRVRKGHPLNATTHGVFPLAGKAMRHGVPDGGFPDPGTGW